MKRCKKDALAVVTVDNCPIFVVKPCILKNGHKGSCEIRVGKRQLKAGDVPGGLTS